MAARKPAKQSVLSKIEREAMKETLRERKAGKTDGRSDLLAAIAKLVPVDRAIAEKLHALVTKHAPELQPKTFYGMPAWAKDDKVVCFFQSGVKFKTRYSTLGFTDKAKLDDGTMWPTSYALMAFDESRIVALVRKAVG